jgi:hypothetical protein
VAGGYDRWPVIMLIWVSVSPLCRILPSPVPNQNRTKSIQNKQATGQKQSKTTQVV